MLGFTSWIEQSVFFSPQWVVKTEGKVKAVIWNLNTIYRPGTGERAQMRIRTATVTNQQ